MLHKLPDLTNTELQKTLTGIHENAKLLVEAINIALADATESVLIPSPRSLGLGIFAEGRIIDIYKELGWKAEPMNNGNKGRCIMFS